MCPSESKLKNLRSRARKLCWDSISDDELLDTRICDLGLKIEGSVLESPIRRLYTELAARGIRLRPHCWLSDEWFSPDGIPGIAIPFYLAHPRLTRLERRQMLDVEGGTRGSLMRILRHEAGHAIDTAFRLHRKRNYREVFGNYFSPYPEYYRPRPNSKNFVTHLEPWYAQSHPAEDFAETFAVWLAPGRKWQADYRGWRALSKLELVDQMMGELVDQAPRVRSKVKIESVGQIRKTLREHYRQLHERFEIDCPPELFEANLRKLFSGLAGSGGIAAEAFIRKNQMEVCRIVSQWTGENLYNVFQVVERMAISSRNLELKASGDWESLKNRFVAMVTTVVMNTLHGSQHRVAL